MTTLQIRRGETFTDPKIGEPFFNTTSNTLQIGSGNGNVVTLTAAGSNFSGFPFTGSAEITGSLNVTGSTNITENLIIQGNLDVQGTSTINLPNGLVSGSSQIEYTEITNLPTLLTLGTSSTTALAGDTVTITTDQANAITTNTSKVGYTDTAVKTKLDAEGVLSGSSQVELPSGLVSGSSQIDFNSILNQPTTITSEQATAISTNSSKVGYTDSLVKIKLDTEGVISGSSPQLLSTSNSLTLSTNTLTLTKGDGSTDTVDLSIYLDNDSRSISSGTLNSVNGIVTFTRDDSTTFTLDLSDLLDDTNLVTSVNGSNGVVVLDTDDISQGTTNLYYTDTAVKTKLNAEGVLSGSAQVELPSGVVSGSSQIEYSEISNIPTLLELGTSSTTALAGDTTTITSEQANAITTNTSKVGYTDAAVKIKLDTEGVISSSAQIASFGFTSDTTEIPAGTVSGSSQVDYTGLQNLPTLLTIGTTSTTALAGDTTTITTDQANAITTNTSKVGYTDAAVKTKLDAEGVISGSSQIDITGTLPAGTVSGSSQVDYTGLQNLPTLLTLGTTSTTALAGDTITITSEQASAITTNTSKVGYTDAAVKTKLDAEGVVSGSGQIDITGNLPSGVVSGSTQVDYTGLQNLPTLLVLGTSSTTALAGDTTTITSEQATAISTNTSKVGYTDEAVKTKLDSEGVISGSSQVDVTGALPSGTVSGSSQIEYSEITNIPTTITSEQATAISTNTSKVGYTDSLVKTKLDTENVVSGSVDDFVKFINSNEVGFSGSLIMEDDTNNIMIGTGSYANYPGTLNVGLGIRPFDADDMGQVSGGDKASGNISIGIGNFRGLNTSGHMRGSYNIGIGLACFSYLQGGDYNIGIGYGALNNLQSSYGGTSYGYSNDNTAIGYFSGRYVYTGTNNTFIGNEAGPSSATANLTNTIYLGNSSITSLRCNVQTISSLSDKRDKTNIQTLPVGLDFVNELKPVSFDWDRRDGTFKDKKDTGFIAQELDETQIKYNIEDYLELVSKDNPDRLEASYSKLIPVLVKAIQELSEEVSSLKLELGK